MTASAGPVLKRLHARYGDEVQFLTVYVREAHPGENYPQPESFVRKMQHAREYRRRDELPWRVAVDDLDGRVHRAFDMKPNAGYFIDEHGRVVFRALWSNDEHTLRRGFEILLGEREAKKELRHNMVVPMLRGMGCVHEITVKAGRQARRDLRREVPPMYALGRLAALFRPLSPLGRGIAATATIGAAAALSTIAAVKLLRRG